MSHRTSRHNEHSSEATIVSSLRSPPAIAAFIPHDYNMLTSFPPSIAHLEVQGVAGAQMEAPSDQFATVGAPDRLAPILGRAPLPPARARRAQLWDGVRRASAWASASLF